MGLARVGVAGKYGLAENVGGLTVKPVGVGGGGNLAVRGDPIGASPPITDGASYDALIYCCPRGGDWPIGLMGDRGRLPAVTMDLMGEGAGDRSAALSPPTRSAQDLPDRED